MKGLLRRAEARTREALVKAMGVALNAVYGPRCPKLLRALRAPSYCSTAMTDAVAAEEPSAAPGAWGT